ncbi:MAG: hypothetical protein JSS72_01905 [Armatimonadetes bacterium]|nr:hypothetical protein [Armatimonadota bacterium]
MTLDFGLIADFASVDASAKMTVVGIFGQLNCRELPVTSPQLSIAAQFTMQRAELGKNHTLEIVLVQPDGTDGFKIGPAPFTVGANSAPVDEAQVPMVFNVRDLKLEKEGVYHWSVRIDNNEIGKIKMGVRKVA